MQICTFFLRSFLVCNRIAPYFVAGRFIHGSRQFASKGNPACHSHHWFRPHHITLLFFTQRVSSNFCGHRCTSFKKYEVFVHHPLQWVSDQWLWRRWVGFYSEAVYHIWGTTKKMSKCVLSHEASDFKNMNGVKTYYFHCRKDSMYLFFPFISIYT